MTEKPTTSGYAGEAADLLKRYESVPFAAAHDGVVDLIPPPTLEVIDIGAGTGRDAAWFAARGDRVTAIEPTREMRDGARMLHPEANVAWVDDSLPDLVTARGRSFDLVWVSGVWMHFDAAERAHMMPTIAALLRPGASLMMSLRRGPFPEGRRMFDVSPEETIALAAAQNLDCMRSCESESGSSGVRLSRLWFRRAAG